MKRKAGNRTLKVFRAYQTNESVLRGFLWKFVNTQHDIEDICQETVTRALEAERSRVIRDPRAFLFGIARNVVRKRLDKQSRSLIDFVEDFSSDQFESSEPLPDKELDDRQQMMMFADAVATLPRQCQRVFIMKKVYGFSHKEIAAKLGISISTVEKHAAAGLKRCMDEIERQQERQHGMTAVGPGSVSMGNRGS